MWKGPEQGRNLALQERPGLNLELNCLWSEITVLVGNIFPHLFGFEKDAKSGLSQTLSHSGCAANHTPGSALSTAVRETLQIKPVLSAARCAQHSN